jgi:hypothetical protein
MGRIEAEPFQSLALDGEPDAEGWLEERLVYRVFPRPRPTFQTVIDVREMFGPQGGHSQITTRCRPAAEPGAVAQTLEAVHELNGVSLEESLELVLLESGGGGLRAGRFERTLRDHGDALLRQEQAHLGAGLTLPVATYPEVLIPFLLRAQPRDRHRRALYAWTSDRFVARVYYETRGHHRVEVPAGTFECAEVWMYPDLNDWIALGGVLTRLAKPFLPRYTMWFELSPPRRVVRFEGPYGPPGAPEVVIELL